MKRSIWMAISLIWILAGVAQASDDVQYWQRLTLKTWQQDPWNLSTTGEFRAVDDVSDASYYQLTQRLGYKWIEPWELGIAYTYLSQETKVGLREVFKDQNRLELEASHRWKPAEWMEIKNRGRVEFRWIEDRGSDNSRYRHLWELVFPVKNVSPMRAVYVNTELFYDFNRERPVEYRSTPIGIDLKLSEKAGLKVFYMIQSTRGTNDWASNQVIGTHVTWSW